MATPTQRKPRTSATNKHWGVWSSFPGFATRWLALTHSERELGAHTRSHNSPTPRRENIL